MSARVERKSSGACGEEGTVVSGMFLGTVEKRCGARAAMAAGFENGHAFDACFKQGILDSIEFGGLENGFNFEHA